MGYSYKDVLNILEARKKGVKEIPAAAAQGKTKKGAAAAEKNDTLPAAGTIQPDILGNTGYTMSAALVTRQAQQAAQDYEDYMRSPERARQQATAYRQKLLEQAMIPGASMSDAPLGQFQLPDPKEEELRLRRDYYESEAVKRQSEDITRQRMAEYETWAPEDQAKLQAWLDNGDISFGTAMGYTDPNAQAMARIGYMELSRKYGAETVTRMEEMLRRSRDEAQAEAARQAAAALPDNIGAGALGFAAARAANFAGNITGPMEQLMELTRKKTGEYPTMNPYGMGQLPGIFGSALDQQISENIRDENENGEASLGREMLATIYRAGASAADSYLRAIAGNGNKHISRALIGTGSFSRALSDYSEKGIDPTRAVLMATVDTGLELITEKVSLDRIIHQASYAPGSLTEFLKNAAIQGGIEMSEEELSFIGSTIAQSVILQGDSDQSRKIAELMAQGMDYASAKNEAERQWLMEGAQVAIESWLSGSMMSGKAQTDAAIKAKVFGKGLNQSGITQADTRELMEAAGQAEDGGDLADLTRDVEKKTGTGAVSEYDQGRLYQTALDQGGDFAEEVQRQWEAAHGMPRQETQQEQKPDAAEDTGEEQTRQPDRQEQTQEPTAQNEPGHDSEVGKVNFGYNAVNPNNSNFTSAEDGKGNYTLYADGTVEPERISGTMNDLKGWRNNGIFYLYDVTVDGTPVTENDALPEGFYRAAGIDRRPAVDWSSGAFWLREKGQIRLESPGYRQEQAGNRSGQPKAEVEVNPMQQQIMDNTVRQMGFQPESERRTPQQSPEAERVRKSLELLGKTVGRKVRLYEKESDANGTENGYYQNGTIHVNLRGRDTHVQVFSHELTHSVEMAEAYRELRDLIFEKIEERGVDLDQLRKNKKAVYAGMDIRLSDSETDSEIIAQYVADYLLTDEASILDLTRKNRNISERIRGWMDKVLSRFGNENAKERDFLRKARDLYAKALRETRHETVKHPESGNDSFDYEEYRELLRQGLASGELSEEQFDDMMESSYEQEELDAQSRYSYAGQKAKTADLKALDLAEELERKNVAAETIRQQTGWFRGKDGKWRFEMDDSSMRYHRSGDAQFSQIHPEYARHQELMNKFLYGELNAEEEAEFRELDEIWGRENRRLRDRVSRGNATLQNVIEHEELFEAYPELRGAKIRFEEMENGSRGRYDPNTNTIFISDNLRNAPESTLLHEIQHAIQNIEGFSPGASVEYWERNGTDGGMTAYEQYEKTTGEIEARDAADRRDLTAQQRKKTPPVLGGEDTVFAEGSKTSYSIIDIAGERENYGSGVLLDTDIFEGIQQKKWGEILSKFVYKNLAGTELTLRDSSGRTETVYLAKENDRVRKDGTKNSRKVLDKLAGYRGDQVRARAIVHISEVLDVSKHTTSTSEHSHQWMDENGWEIRKAYLQTMDGKIYEVTLNIADGRNGKTLYEINRVHMVDKAKTSASIPSTDESRRSRYQEPEMGGTQSEASGSLSSNNTSVKPQFSISPAEGQNQQGQQEQQEQPPSQREPDQAPERTALPAKARSVLEGVERKLLADIGDKMYVPRFARRDTLKPIMQEISNAYLRDGTISEALADELFDRAYASGIVVDSEFYDQYKEIKQHMRNTAVTISQQDRSDIPDFGDFRRRAFGALKIVNEGGLPVDVAYQELNGMAPELFPEGITHPADQLQHMLEVARSIEVSYKNIQEYFGDDAEGFRAYAKGAFRTAMEKAGRELRNVRQYAEEAKAKAENGETPVTYEEAVEAFRVLTGARKSYERVAAKTLLTDADQIEVGRLLNGDILPEHLDPERHNVEGILAVYEAKKEYDAATKTIGRYKKHLKGQLRKQADGFLETALKWKDKKSGLAYSRETMRRNVRDIVGDKKLADEINEAYFEPVHVSEAAATRFKAELRNRVRALNLSRKIMKGNLVSESHAVQLIGEAMDNIEILKKTRGRIRVRDGKTIDEWQSVIDEVYRQSPGLDQAKIEGAIKEFRTIYDELFQKMNEVRVRNGYEPVPYRQGYFPHFQDGEEGMLARFAKAMGLDTQVNALPTTINGLTHSFRPGIQWFGNAQKRLGFNTTYDALQGFDMYIEGVANVIYHTENIQKLRALESQIRYRTSEEGIRKQVDAVHEDTRLTEEEKQMKIEEIYKKGKFTLSNFVDELTEYTNLLAGKKSRLDRTTEALMGRRIYTIMKNLESRVGANMIAGNLGSALTNFIPLTQAGAQLDRNMILKGMWDTLKSYKEDDGLIAASDFLTNRRGSDPIARTWKEKTANYLLSRRGSDPLVRSASEKISTVLGSPMELIDGFVSGSIVRAAYQQNLRNGMSEAEAMHQADIFASGVMADRSKGSMPTLFESRNPVFKAITQFQLEVNNQFSEVFKDLPRGQREKGMASLIGVLLRYFLGAYLYNEVYEYFIGRRPAMDPLGILNNTAGDWLGYELPNLVEWGVNTVKGEETSLKTEKVGLGEAAKNLGTEVLGQLPFSAGLTLLGVETDGGRIPASAAIPDLTALWDAATTEGWSKEKRWHEAQKELNKLAYVLPPFAGGQISKTWKGVKAYLEGGSYTVNADGEELLQYPVMREEANFDTLVRMALLGKSSIPEAQEWTDSGFDGFNARQTAAYKDMQEAGATQREAFDLIRKLDTVEETQTQTRSQLQRKALLESGLEPEAVAVAYYGLLANEKTRAFMDSMADQGADVGEVAEVLMRIQDAESSNEERNALLHASLTDEEKHAIYREKISDGKEDEISQLRAAGVDFDGFLQIQNRYTQINDLDLKAGKKATEFSHWLNEQGYTERQKTVIKDCFRYFSMVPAAAARYDRLTSAGLTESAAYDITEKMEALTPRDGETQVDDLQRYRVIVDSGIPEAQQMKALSETIGDGLFERVNVCYENGVSPGLYLQFREILPNFDSNGSGTFSQAEIKTALDSMGESGDDNPLLLLIGDAKPGTGLTRKQKAVIWQSYNKTWKPNRNPYDTKVGEAVYAIMNDDGSEVADAQQGSADFGDEMMRQLIESMR